MSVKKTIHWICSILEKHKVPFQITGGLAAIIYGSKRKLNDIDIDIPVKYFKIIFPDIKKHVIFNGRYKDECFDIPLITISYSGRQIDLAASDSGKMFDKKKGKWVEDEKTDLSKSPEIIFFGKKMKIIPKKDLIEYKKMIARQCDLEDLRYLSKRLIMPGASQHIYKVAS
jgi:hypothetical protein